MIPPQKLIAYLKPIAEKLYALELPISIRLLKYSENITFLLTESNGRKTVLRLNRPGYHDEAELIGELLWMQEISRDTPLRLPKVFPGRNGALLQSFCIPGTEMHFSCCLFSFLEGKMLGDVRGAQALPLIHTLGATLAVLHEQSRTRDKRIPIRRFSWDLSDLLGEQARWGDWRSYHKLTSESRSLVEKALGILQSRIKAFGRSEDRYGLIHADLHRSNIIFNDGQAQIFDFDDCGYGWYLYDFGCSLVEYSDELESMTDALVSGYETVRKLSTEEKNELDSFILLRRIVRLAWLESHADSDTAKNVETGYLRKTYYLIKNYIQRFGTSNEVR